MAAISYVYQIRIAHLDFLIHCQGDEVKSWWGILLFILQAGLMERKFQQSLFIIWNYLHDNLGAGIQMIMQYNTGTDEIFVSYLVGSYTFINWFWPFRNELIFSLACFEPDSFGGVFPPSPGCFSFAFGSVGCERAILHLHWNGLAYANEPWPSFPLKDASDILCRQVQKDRTEGLTEDIQQGWALCPSAQPCSLGHSKECQLSGEIASLKKKKKKRHGSRGF